ncbi:Transposon Ty3-I Gag-Pol polyprotein [Acropora cervicornis]|uniref:Transposon Ty3-I Gag-Pol polyprotein n=1 Tax=Acropora cervicornis TaxID=6130 RepID=A0AAD9VE26_ACRCE|nr:Transposon Ty3-I Gag-Pol polyprotein [Acropora cervicornis]
MSDEEADGAPVQNAAAHFSGNIMNFERPKFNARQENRLEALKAFKKKCGYIFKGSLVNISEERKCILVQDWLGPEGQKIYDSLDWGEDEDVNNYELMWTKLEGAVSAECNEIVASKKFKERVQKPKETITSFVTDLMLLVKDCNYIDEDRQIDSGSTCSILPVGVYKEISGDHDLQDLNTTVRPTLSLYDEKTKIQTLGTRKCFVVNPATGEEVIIQFRIVNEDLTPLIGLSDSEELKLIELLRENIATLDSGKPHVPSSALELHTPLTMANILSKYAAVFDNSVGKLEGELHLYTKQDVTPSKAAPREIPLSVKNKLIAEIKDLQEQGIIEKVTEPTDWVSAPTIVNKPSAKNGLRLCIDSRPLNTALRRSEYPIPTVDQLLTEISNAKVFTLADIKSVFWHVPLDEPSSLLTTFNTPVGRMKWNRMPFGISVAPEEFQRRIDESLEGLEGTKAIADDILIWGDGNTIEEATSNHDARLSALLERCQQKHIKLNVDKFQLRKTELSYMGVTLTDKGVKPDPRKQDSIQAMPAPTNKEEVRRLLEANKQQAFEDIKALISSAPLLKYFNPDLPVEIQTDASSSGLGACLMQGGQPVQYASRALTETEKRYSQIEKEMLSVVFVVKGKDLLIADALSRSHTRSQSEEEIETIGLVIQDQSVTSHLREIAEETAKDNVLQSVIRLISENWSISKRRIPTEVFPFWSCKDQLSFNDGIIYRGDRIVVPATLRKSLTEKLHQAHMGVESTLRRARTSLWWPGMNSQLKQFISSCQVCQSFQRNNPKETLMSHCIPDRPWSKIAADPFEFKGEHYLVLVDYYSDWIEFDKMRDQTATETIALLLKQFSRWGLPDEIVTDCGKNFDSKEFSQFCQRKQIKHTKSSPHHHQSNGKAESAVKIAKSILRKTENSALNPYEALLDQHNTPTVDMTTSPAQRFLHRRLKSEIPMKATLLTPEIAETVLKEKTKKTTKSQLYYNRTAKDLSVLKPGDTVTIKPERLTKGQQWRKGLIVQKHPFRAYDVEVDGKLLRTNRVHLKPAVKPLNLDKRQSAQNPKADVKVRASETKTSSSNSVPSPPKLKSQPTQPVKFAKKMELVVAHRTRSGRLVKVPTRYSS